MTLPIMLRIPYQQFSPTISAMSSCGTECSSSSPYLRSAIVFSPAIPTSIAFVARFSLFIHYNKALLFIANVISEDVTSSVSIDVYDCFVTSYILKFHVP